MSRVTRRQFSAGVLSVLGTQTLTNCATGLPPRLPVSGDAVDVHCHFFNGSDIPVVRYITQVVIPDNEKFRTSLKGEIEDPTAWEVVLGMLRHLLLLGVPTA